MSKSKAAFLLASQTLGKQQLFLWTFTFKDLLSVKDTRKRWNHLLTLLLRRWPKLQGLRVFELHKEHGLHVHLLTNQFIDVNEARRLALQANWGRIHVTRVPSEHAGYLAKYLSKQRAECLRRWRLWAGFGAGWEWTKVKDLIRETVFSRIYRGCKEWKQWQGREKFFERMALARQIMLLTIENGWQIGCGPNGLPYSSFEEEDFWFVF
ncbi:MAG TPA: hypothetical protein VE822_05470 [Candidatus Elarobacter sp.]|nr:MAG: hypothetical protein DME40_07190 [Verrucomicrobiota bacterium]PYL90591.1 MAG: hypothetical protein DMF16_04495 [Verrucomicrobiota bacterium]HYW98540.1 hypothetical protein [Candidatus Elarobacter sp.]